MELFRDILGVEISTNKEIYLLPKMNQGFFGSYSEPIWRSQLRNQVFVSFLVWHVDCGKVGQSEKVWNGKRRRGECEEARWEGAPAIEPDHCTFVRVDNFFGEEYSVFLFLHRNIFYFLYSPIVNSLRSLTSILSKFTTEQHHHFIITIWQFIN